MFRIYHIISKAISVQLLLVGVLLGLGLSLKAQSLEELKTISAENNLDLKAQYKSFEAQLENVTQAKSWEDPNLSFGYFISPIETRVGPQLARFSLTQMLPWFGTFKTKGKIAVFRAEAEYEKFQDQKLKLFLEVAEQYYELAALRQITQLEAKQLQILNDVKEMTNANYENNKAQLVDVLRVDLEIDKHKNTIQVLKEQDQALVTQLNQLMNRSLQTPIEILNPKQVLEQQALTKSKLISEDHTRLKAIRNLQESNKAETKLAKKQAMPQFGIGLDYAIIQDRNVNAIDAGQDAIIPNISISLPIFGVKNKSRKKQASLQGESLQFQLEDEKSKLDAEIQVAKYQYDELLSSVKLHNKQMQNLDDILKLSRVALANAEMDIEEYLRLQEEHVMHHKMKFKTLAELKKTKAKLNYLTSK